MLFAPVYTAHRHVRPVLTDDMAKAILSQSRIVLTDGAIPVQGRVIGWKRTAQGTLGAIVANPLTGSRHLWAVDFETGSPRRLARLA